MKSWLSTKSTGRLPRLGALAVAVGTIGGLYWAYTRTENLSLPTFVTSQETKPQRAVPQIAAIGYLEPQGEVIEVSASLPGEGRPKIDKLLVKEGDTVKASQIIAILDNNERLRASLNQAQSRAQIALARLQQVKAGAKFGDIQAQNAQFNRINAELEGQISVQKAAIASLEAQLQGERASQIAQINEIEAKLRNADNDCRRYDSLYKDGAVSVQERDRVCLILETSQASLTAATANLKRIEKTLKARIQEARANLARTITTLDKQIVVEKARLQAVSEVRPVDVELAQTELQSALSDIEKAKADLALSYVKAPRDGKILNVHTRPGELIADKGIVELANTERMYVTAQVYETDISRVRQGQSATIKSPGVAGDLRGIVDEVGFKIGRKDVLGNDPVADVDARVVEVKIRIHPQDSQKVANLTNLQVNVIIDDTPKTN
jgi:ABC exporter DevB family membrane fusion protein